MIKKYKINFGNETYTTCRRSHYFLALMCKLILLRRRLIRTIKRELKNNRISKYLFMLLIFIYTIFFFVDTYLLKNNIENYLIYLWNSKEMFVSSIIVVIFINIVVNIQNRKKMLEERFELCNNIKMYFFDFLSILNYNTYIDLKNISVKDLISNMDLENIKITNKILTNHKNNIIIILNKVYIVKQLDGDDGSIRREYIIRELNHLYNINISNSMKIEVILNIYKILFDYFYSIWNQDNDINSIIKIIFPTQDKYY